MGVRVVMDFFQHRYYRINKVLLMAIGQWPYQTIPVRGGCVAFIIFLAAIQFVPQMMAVVKRLDDWELLLECVVPILFEATLAAKMICSMWNTQKMQNLLYRIRTNWQEWARDQEVNILHEYAEQGRKWTIAYAGLIYINGIVFTTQPVIPKIINILLGNGSVPGQFPFPVDYHHLDMQKYYFHIITFAYVSTCGGCFVTTACDAMYIVYVLHACGMFAALGHKLERFGENERSAEKEHSMNASNERDVNLISCVGRHNDAIEYAKLIEATYSWCFLFMVGLNMLAISITGFQIVRRKNDLHETVRYIAVLVTNTTHLYVESYMAQILMDHSISIRYYIYNSKWYRLPLKTQKLLLLMTMRGIVPCTLTAGNISIMSIETFGVFLKTSLSYFTLLRTI